jgi:tight adherence protein C
VTASTGAAALVAVVAAVLVVGPSRSGRSRRPRVPPSPADTWPADADVGPPSATGAAPSWVAGRWRSWCGGLGGRVLAARWWSATGVGPGPAAGPRDPAAGRADAAARRVGATLTLALAALLVSPLLALPVGAVTWAWPAWRARSERSRRHQVLVEAMPDVVELFRLSVGAGLSVHLALRAVVVRIGEPALTPLVEVVARQDRGQPLAEALEGLTAHGETWRPLSSALVAAERYGSALAPALDRVSIEARDLRRRQAEETARRLPVLMLFPLVLCILPAGALLSVVPLVAASWPRLVG